ncbi:MAG: YfiR family protein [Chitinophagaceae bacterium]|nr:YfiR family protein [Rubrivivax sp.]
MPGFPSAARLSSRLAIGALLTALQCLTAAGAQTPGMARENAVKAAFLSKFAGFVDWPAGTPGRYGQPLVIGVMGSDSVAADLDQIIGASSADGSTVVVRRLRDGESPADLHVLFIGTSRETRVREMAAAVRGPVLIVTEHEDGLRLGGVLNFVVDGGRVRFTASVPAATARGLRLSARLLAVAQAVEGGGR